MADWVDPASRPFKVHSGEATRRQIADSDEGDDNFVFDVGRELVEVDVEESYVNDDGRDPMMDETLDEHG